MNEIYKLLTLILIGLDCHAQTIIPQKEGYIFYEMIDSAGGNKRDLYSEARKWISSPYGKTLNVPNAPTEEDKLAGEIVGKRSLAYNLSSGTNALIELALRINVKDNKYRIQAYDFQGYFLATSDSAKDAKMPINLYTDLELYKKGTANKMIMELIEGLNEQMNLLLKDFRSAMKSTKPEKETADSVIK